MKKFSNVKDWQMLGYLLGDRNCQDRYQRFRKNYGDAPEMLLTQWRQKHPYASWTLLYQGLTTMNEVDLANEIKDTYLSGIASWLHVIAYLCLIGVKNCGENYSCCKAV